MSTWVIEAATSLCNQRVSTKTLCNAHSHRRQPMYCIKDWRTKRAFSLVTKLVRSLSLSIAIELNKSAVCVFHQGKIVPSPDRTTCNICHASDQYKFKILADWLAVTANNPDCFKRCKTAFKQKSTIWHWNLQDSKSPISLRNWHF